MTFKIIRHLGVLSVSRSDWTKELTVVEWNEGEPKYDIREWSPDYEKMSRGITLTAEEAVSLAKFLGEATQEISKSSAKKRRLCPRCGKAYAEEPALSRQDNKTEICPECGTAEAVLVATRHGAL